MNTEMKKAVEVRINNVEAVSATFDIALTAKIGDIMYLLKPEYKMKTDRFGYVIGNGKLIAREAGIKKVIINRISYSTGSEVVLYGITEDGRKEGAVQELFFRSFEAASLAVKKINEYYESFEANKDWFVDFKNAVDIEYIYKLKFPVKPKDILTTCSGQIISVNKIFARNVHR